MTRPPPHNIDAERALLGSLMLSPDAIVAVADTIAPEDYYRPAHGHIHEAIIALWSAGKPTDPVTIAEHLDGRGLLGAVGGPAGLNLQNATPAISSAPHYAAIVRNTAMLRRLIAVAGEICEIGYTAPHEQVADAIDRAEQFVYQLGAPGVEASLTMIDELMRVGLENLERRFEGGADAGLTTGIRVLDRLTGPLGPGSLVTIAGRPAMGKSHAGAHIALHAACGLSWPVLFVSAEMSADQMADRIIAHEANVSLEALRGGQLADYQWHLITSAVAKVGAVPLFLQASGTVTVNAIRATARRIHARTGRQPVIIVDYIQLLAPSGRHENRQTEIASLSRALKGLALDLGTVVFSLAQVNRGVETRADKRPTLADLRESGAIEADSDVVVFIYRDDYYDTESKDAGLVEMIVAKNRHGRTGTATCRYMPDTGRYFPLIAERQES